MCVCVCVHAQGESGMAALVRTIYREIGTIKSREASSENGVCVCVCVCNRGNQKALGVLREWSVVQKHNSFVSDWDNQTFSCPVCILCVCVLVGGCVCVCVYVCVCEGIRRVVEGLR